MKPPPPPGKPNAIGLEMAIQERDDILKWMAQAKARELELRKYIAAQLFPKPKEGTNKVIAQGVEAKLVYKINRKVLEPEYLSLRPGLLTRGVPCDKLVLMQPKLIMDAYRQLTGVHRKLFDQCLEIKPSETPELDINAGG